MNLLNYDIVLTYSKSNTEKDRICGHTFEVLDYYLYFLDNNIKAVIVIQDDIDLDKIKDAWNNNYNLNKEVVVIKSKGLIIGKTILNCSGFYKNEDTKYIAKKLFQFRCGVFQNDYIQSKGIIVLQDNRIFEDKPQNSINYVKKLNKKYIKVYTNQKEFETFMYWNTELRVPTPKRQEYLVNKYSGNIISNQDLIYNQIYPPINILKRFNNGRYIYTEVTRRFDCSSRLLIECLLNNIEIVFDFDISTEEYFNIDKGLYYRWYDIQHNIDNLFLDNDNLKELIWEENLVKQK